MCTKHVKYFRKSAWLDQELQTAIHFRDSLRENGQEVEYREQRNLVTAMERNKMKIYTSSKLIECKSNAKNIWKANKKTSPVITIFSNALNSHIASISKDKSEENNLDKVQKLLQL